MIAQAFTNQIAYCLANNAPVTARAVEAIWASIDESSEFGRRVLGWTGNPLADALPLRCTGGFHALYLANKEPALEAIYGAEMQSEAQCAAAARIALRNHEADLLPWLDGPPQTNEMGRSSNYIAALHWLASKGLPAQFELNEIGSSAGLNLLLAHYHYNLAGIESGPKDAALSFTPEWRGAPPPADPVEIVSAQGCDVAPVDLTDPVEALRLQAYIWPEHTIRFERMAKGIDLVHQFPPVMVKADAADFVEQRLATPQAVGTTRVLMHSIVWQYVPKASQDRVIAAMEAAGAKATPDRPLAWISVEANRSNYQHELSVRTWPGDGERIELAKSHAHGAWIEWNA